MAAPDHARRSGKGSKDPWRRTLRCGAVFLSLAVTYPCSARADGPGKAPLASPAGRPADFANSASLSFFSFFGPGVTVEYERLALPPVVSFVSALGFRATGGSDYGTVTLTTSLEARLWLANLGPWRPPGRSSMDGPLLALREDVAFTTVENRARNRLAGTAVEVAETLSIGYRLTLWRLHVTPLVGGALTSQVGPQGRLPPLTFLSGKLAITFGVMF